MNKLIRITTVPSSLKILLKGQHHFMSKMGFDVIGISSGGQELQEVSRFEDVAVAEIQMTRTISPLKDLISLWNFYKFCKKEKPIIVHSHTPKAGIVGMLGAKLAGVPIRVHTVAGLPLMEAKGIKRKLLNFVEKLTYRCATKVYPNSKGLYNFIIHSKFTDESKLKVIANGSSNGVDKSFFSQHAVTEAMKRVLQVKLHISPKDFVFIFVGRLVGDKGINELIHAYSEISEAGNVPNSKLLLVGSFEAALDPLLPETLSKIEKIPSIITVGFQNDVRPYFAVSNCLVFPSYREGFPNVVMQAGAMGLPAIVTDINGCNEIIVEGENGTIIPPKNSEALQEAMVKMLTDSTWRQQLQQKARPMIASRYDQQRVWEALLSEYQTLLQQKGIGN